MAFQTRHFNKTMLTVLVTAWTTIVWIGGDMYLPALPVLGDTFPVSEAVVNSTLVAFGIAMPFGSLLGGAYSDRAGRRGPIIFGGILYTISSIVCAAAPTIWILIAARVVGGFGGGVICAVMMAVLKDELDGDELDRAITFNQSFIAVGPVAAPFLGSLMLAVMGWRGIFVLLSILTLASFIAVLPIAESLPPEKRADVSVARSVGLVADVAKNRSFTVLLLALTAPAFVFGVFMTLCSYIYIDDFGIGNFGYSVCYGISTAICIGGPGLFLLLNRRVGSKHAVAVISGMLLASGLLILAFGRISAIAFLLATLPFVLTESMARPCAFLVLMRAEEKRAGSASALINFAIGIMCALGTPAASLSIWGGHMNAMGGLTVIAGLWMFAFLAILLFGLRSNILDN